MNRTMESTPVTTLEIAASLNAVEPRAFLIAARTLKRIIKTDRAIGGMGLHAPHPLCYSVKRDALLAVIDPDELAPIPVDALPDTVILIAKQSRIWKGMPCPAILRVLWQRLFHARLDLELVQARREGRLPDDLLRQVKREIGQIEFEEAIRVMRQEDLIFPGDDWRDALLEFAAVFFELRFFAAEVLPCFFPGLKNLDNTEKTLRQLIDPDPLLATTKIAGAAEEDVSETALDPDVILQSPSLSAQAPVPVRSEQLLQRANVVRAKGNLVRSILLCTRAKEFAPPAQLGNIAKQLVSDFDLFAARLGKAVHLTEEDAKAWRAALPCLAAPTSRGVWPAAARFLYDLQKACVDTERELFALDLVEWVCSLGKKAIKRPVPLQADALLVKHLRGALNRLPAIRIEASERRRLAQLLHQAIHHGEENLRDRIRPLLIHAFNEVGFRPVNLPEQVALHKLTEELLDRLAERGFINMGDVRDAVSRNQLKMPDISPAQMLLGDPLIIANRKLAIMLDGVYHRGEFYLRWLQRLSSLLFGNPVGRWLVLFVILPFGGSLATAIFAQEMLHLGQIHLHVDMPARDVTLPSDEAQDDAPKTGLQWHVPRNTALFALGGLGVFYLLLMHVPPIRAATWNSTKSLGRLLRFVFWDIPWAILYWRPLRAVLDSAPFVFFRRRIFRPLILAGVAVILAYLLGPDGLHDEGYFGAAVFVVGLVGFNSRMARVLEDSITDWVARNWYWLRADFLPGLIRLILDVFKMAVDQIERVLYTVDEWLRFRPGDGKLANFLKPVLGLVWFFFTYLIRVVINLFVEPTINPVKHFPAVTVGAKLIIPLIPAWSVAMTHAMEPFVGLALAGTIAGTIIILIPGIFGFAVWEFKENWKLYSANRPKNLKPVMIGHHGETMLQLLRPGFHSGTLPRTFAKLRDAYRKGKRQKVHALSESLHHVSETVRHFVEREMIAFLTRSKAWGDLPIVIKAVDLSTNRITVHMTVTVATPDGVLPLELIFEESRGWLLATLRHTALFASLDVSRRAAFSAALAGTYKRAAVHLVREQIEARIGSNYRLDGNGLVLDPDLPDRQRQVDLTQSPGSDEYAEVLFFQRPLFWSDWVLAWERDQAGETPELGIRDILPADQSPPSR